MTKVLHRSKALFIVMALFLASSLINAAGDPAPAGLYEFPQVESSWGAKLNPNNDFPDYGYMGYFFNTNNPEILVHKEPSSSLGINYAWSDFHNIKSEDFGAYWAGSIVMPEAGEKIISASLSWAKIRIIIDDHLIYEGGSDTEVKLQLDKGRHTIEVEYINNWHTTDVMVRVQEPVQLLTRSQVKAELERTSEPHQLYYVGAYESDAQDGVVQLNLRPAEQPMVLFLGSYNPIQWHINNPHNNAIKAIVYSSFKPGAMVTGDIDTNPRLMALDDGFRAYELVKKCSCSGSHFHCSGKDFSNTLKQVEDIGNGTLVGFSGDYNPIALPVPQTLMNDATRNMMAANRREVNEQRERCSKNINPDFDSMFD